MQTLGALRRLASPLTSLVHRRRLRWWRAGELAVAYRNDLDGGGSFAAPDYLRVLRGHRDVPVDRVFEWCCGPGFIGYSTLASGLARTACFADVNARAVQCVRLTAERNQLEDAVSAYVSDNLQSVPPSEQFDLVVGNPPSYCGLNPRHPLFHRYRDDLRPNDPGWRVHREFFRTIGGHLRPGALMIIGEVEIESAEVRAAGDAEPYDIRPRPPIIDFREMIDEAGLELVTVEPLAVLPGGFDCQAMVIRRP